MRAVPARDIVASPFHGSNRRRPGPPALAVKEESASSCKQCILYTTEKPANARAVFPGSTGLANQEDGRNGGKFRPTQLGASMSPLFALLAILFGFLTPKIERKRNDH